MGYVQAEAKNVAPLGCETVGKHVIDDVAPDSFCMLLLMDLDLFSGIPSAGKGPGKSESSKKEVQQLQSMWCKCRREVVSPARLASLGKG